MIDFEKFKNKLLYILLINSLILVLLGTIAIFIWEDYLHAKNYKYVYVCMLLTVVLLFLFFKKLSLKIKSAIFVVTFMFGGLTTIYVWEMLGAGIVVMLIGIVLSELFFKRRFTIVSIILNVIILILIFIGKHNGLRTYIYLSQTNYFNSWIAQILAYAYFSSLLSYLINKFKNYILENYTNLTIKQKELDRIQNNNKILGSVNF